MTTLAPPEAAATPSDPYVGAVLSSGGTWTWVAVGVAAVLPLAWTTTVDEPAWALRWAMLPAVAGLGLPLLLALACGRGAHRRPARWALGFLGWAALSSTLAPRPALSFWGEYEIGTGLIFLLALAGAWAIGVRVGRAGPCRVATALLAGCVIQALLAIGEQLAPLGAIGLSPYEGRSAALFGNPVYLAELLCGGLWLALWRLAAPGRRARWPAVVAALLIATGLDLSGSRAALVLAVAATLIAAGWAPGLRRLTVIATVAGGLTLGAVVGSLATGSTGATTATSRASTTVVAADGYAPRLSTWEGGLEGLTRRPLWGWGPGDFLAAAGPERTLTVARDNGPDTLFADAHDVVVEVAVTTGLAGLALAALWILTAFGLCRRPATPRWGLAGFAVLVLGVTLAEPLHPGVTPLALLALGAAGANGANSGQGRRAGKALAAVAALIGLATSIWLAAGLAAAHDAELAESPSSAAVAARHLPPWGQTAAEVANLTAFDDITAGRSPSGAALRWWAAAAAQDPANPSRWLAAGDAEATAGHGTAAAADYRRALADNPWSVHALQALVKLGPPAGVAAAERDADRTKLATLGAAAQ